VNTETVVRFEWTLDDLDALIQGEQAEPSGDTPTAYTMNELVEQTGAHRGAVAERLQRLKAAGKLRAGRERREALDGTMRWVPVYIIQR